MTLTTRIELRLASYGFNRSLLLRVMIRFGHTKLRSLRTEAVAGRGPRGFVLRQTMNALERRVLRKAVSAHTCTARLQIVDDQSWSKLEEYGDHPYTEQVLTVDTVAIDDLIARGEVPPPTVVKIDVEGAEIAVLHGMRHTIEE